MTELKQFIINGKHLLWIREKKGFFGTKPEEAKLAPAPKNFDPKKAMTLNWLTVLAITKKDMKMDIIKKYGMMKGKEMINAISKDYRKTCVSKNVQKGNHIIYDNKGKVDFGIIKTVKEQPSNVNV